MHKKRNSSANALELSFFCIKLLIQPWQDKAQHNQVHISRESLYLLLCSSTLWEFCPPVHSSVCYVSELVVSKQSVM